MCFLPAHFCAKCVSFSIPASHCFFSHLSVYVFLWRAVLDRVLWKYIQSFWFCCVTKWTFVWWCVTHCKYALCVFNDCVIESESVFDFSPSNPVDLRNSYSTQTISCCFFAQSHSMTAPKDMRLSVQADFFHLQYPIQKWYMICQIHSSGHRCQIACESPCVQVSLCRSSRAWCLHLTHFIFSFVSCTTLHVLPANIFLFFFSQQPYS